MEIKNLQVDQLSVHIYQDKLAMGKQAAREASVYLCEMLKQKSYLNIVFAAAPSQNEFLAALTQEPGIDWGRINAFHMDEYIGLTENSEQSFAHYLKAHIFDLVPFSSVSYIYKEGLTPQQQCQRYTELLSENQIDIVFMGIGENGHIAFNDPFVAKFNDDQTVKIVELDEMCRYQQVHDKCFSKISDVPKQAITLTIPTLMSAKRMFCVVSSGRKAKAVHDTLQGTINENCPATILRTHKGATLYLDMESAGLLK